MGSRKLIVRKKTSFSTKDRFKGVLNSTLTVETRVLDQQPSSTITGINTAVNSIVDIHNANIREFAEEIQTLIPIDKQGQLEKLLKFYLM